MMNQEQKTLVLEAEDYLRNGGLGEVYGLADAAMHMGQPKVQMDTDMAVALCRFAMLGQASIDKEPST